MVTSFPPETPSVYQLLQQIVFSPFRRLHLFQLKELRSTSEIYPQNMQKAECDAVEQILHINP